MDDIYDLDNPLTPSSSRSPSVRDVHPAQPSFAPYQDPRRNPQTGAIISKIEEILAANIDALKENRVLTIPLRSRSTGRIQLVRFPSTRESEVKKFTALLQILHLSHEALVAGTVITKRFAIISFCLWIKDSSNMVDRHSCRAIYYQNPELFGSQQYVDKLVDDLAFTLESGRDALNIVATSKGLIAGAISVTINNGSILHCDPDDGHGVLLPDVQAISNVHIGSIKWLLVIEKEATFRGLAASGFHKTAIAGPGILITAKGYPDLSTRQFLHKLHASFPMLPMYGLVDFDPHGVKIIFTYKNGSRSLQHEENTTLNRLFWIGPKSNDIFGAGVRALPSDELDQSQSQTFNHIPPSPVDTMLPLKVTDRKLAIRLLSCTVGRLDQGIESTDFVRELHIMLFLNTKAEIQAVDDAGDLTKWLDNTLMEKIEGI
ncbi:Spo11/DNA topoisomerase VI subunit A [Xylaria venustula]|nr:Spo11/DNA topoisomerase VI subunit A [Xylaria venustula]